MYKLKNTFIDKMIRAHLTSTETQTTLTMSKYQDETGIVWCVNYKEIAAEAGISYQSFYNAIYALEKKGLICINRYKGKSISVKFIDNDFSDKDFSVGYFCVAKRDIDEPRFKNLPGKAKLLYLYLCRFTAGIHYGLQNGYEKFAELLDVTVRTVRWYFYLLKSNKLLGVKMERNKAYNYEMYLKITQVLVKAFPKHENELKHENMRSYICHNFKQYMPQNSHKMLNDILSIMNQKRAQKDANFFVKIIDAIDDTVSIIKSQSGTPVLNAALINKCLSRRLSMN